jgi:hypothetical protein
MREREAFLPCNFSFSVAKRRSAFVLLGVLACGCNAMRIPCFTKDRPDLVGTWRFVGRPPGFDPDLADRLRPHPDELQLRADGTYRVRFTGSQLQRRRELDPDLNARYPQAEEATFDGQWHVGWFCPGDLFLPTQWLRFKPGPVALHFELENGRLTLFHLCDYFGPSYGHCFETYERTTTALGSSPNTRWETNAQEGACM